MWIIQRDAREQEAERQEGGGPYVAASLQHLTSANRRAAPPSAAAAPTVRSTALAALKGATSTPLPAACSGTASHRKQQEDLYNILQNSPLRV